MDSMPTRFLLQLPPPSVIWVRPSRKCYSNPVHHRSCRPNPRRKSSNWIVALARELLQDIIQRGSLSSMQAEKATRHCSIRKSAHYDQVHLALAKALVYIADNMRPDHINQRSRSLLYRLLYRTRILRYSR